MGCLCRSCQANWSALQAPSSPGIVTGNVETFLNWVSSFSLLTVRNGLSRDLLGEDHSLAAHLQGPEAVQSTAGACLVCSPAPAPPWASRPHALIRREHWARPGLGQSFHSWVRSGSRSHPFIELTSCVTQDNVPKMVSGS